MNNLYSPITLKFLLASSILMGVSCSKDFLSNTPKGYKLAVNTADYNDMLEDNTLSSMADYTSGTGAFVTPNGVGILGDDVATLYPAITPYEAMYGGSAIAARALFSWSKDIWRLQSNSNELLAGFNKIYISNKIINEVMDSQNGTEEQKKQYRAEALANRAFNYFFLVNLFTKPYNSGTVDTDLGMPIIREANAVGNNFTRASLKETYDLMLEDLTSAIPDLPVTQTSASRFTRSAAEALLGKLYLFMGNYTEAVTQLDRAVLHLPGSFFVSGAPAFINYNTAEENPFPIFNYVFNVPGLSGSSQTHPYPESLLARDILALMVGGQFISGVVVTPETLSMFGETDKRLSLFSSSWGLGDGQVGEIPFGLKRINAGNFGYSVGIQLPDLYLLRAEAKARTDDLSGATESLVEVRKNRMPETDAATVPSAKDDLIKFIIDERKREFCGFGVFRWHDMRRLFDDPLFAGEVYTHYQYDQTEGLQKTFTLSRDGLTLQFPEIVLKQNPGFEQNP